MMIRPKSGGRFDVGNFLVDVGCVGVRDAYFKVMDEDELEEVKAAFFPGGCEEKDGAWGRKFVEGAVAYGHSLGFKPHRDYKKASRLFGGLKAADCPEEFEYGRNGKPFYVQGAFHTEEQAQRIIAQLERRCGPDGFHYLMKVEELPEGLAADLLDGADDEADAALGDLLEAASEGTLEDPASAEQTLLSERNRRPHSSFVHYVLGTFQAIQGRHEEARENLQRAVDLAPWFAEAWQNLATTCKVLERIPEMAFALRKVTEEAEPDDPCFLEARDQLAQLEKMVLKESGLSLDDWMEAGLVYQEGLDAMAESEWEEGERLMREAAVLNPRSYQSFNNLGLCLTFLGRKEEARTAFQEALRIKPDHASAQVNLDNLDNQD